MHGQRNISRITTECRAAVADAETLIEQSRGVNLDPIIDALDERLRTRSGAIDPAAIAGLRPRFRICAESCDTNRASARQLAAQLLCSMDDPALASVAAAADRGVAALVPAIATAVFSRMNDRSWSLCGALAALVAVEGVGTMCQGMGRELPPDRLATAS